MQINCQWYTEVKSYRTAARVCHNCARRHSLDPIQDGQDRRRRRKPRTQALFAQQFEILRSSGIDRLFKTDDSL